MKFAGKARRWRKKLRRARHNASRREFRAGVAALTFERRELGSTPTDINDMGQSFQELSRILAEDMSRTLDQEVLRKIYEDKEDRKPKSCLPGCVPEETADFLEKYTGYSIKELTEGRWKPRPSR